MLHFKDWIELSQRLSIKILNVYRLCVLVKFNNELGVAIVSFSLLSIISFLSQMKTEMIKSYNVVGQVVFSHEDHAYVCLPPSLLWVLAKENWVVVNTQTAVHSSACLLSTILQLSLTGVQIFYMVFPSLICVVHPCQKS